MHQEAKEYPSFPLGNRLYIRLCLYSRGKTFHMPSEENEDYSSSMISSIRHKQSTCWTILNNTMAISAKELPKNHTDKERFAAASSCIATGILTLLFPLKRRRSVPSPSSATAF